MNRVLTQVLPRGLTLPILLSILMLPISGCVSVSQPPIGQDTSVLNPEACKPPCWHGITPGQTGLEDARQIVGHLSFVDPESVQVGHDIQPGYDATIFWRYRGGGRETSGGRIATKTGIVTFMRVSFVQSVALADIVAAQGNPDLVIIGLRPDGLHNVQMFYQKRGLWLDGTQPYAGKVDEWRAVMAAEMRIDQVEYFVPSDLMTYLIGDAGMASEDARSFAARFKPWPGLVLQP